ncbi:MAG: UDP-2,4-diacetamido-2,4,6-trideoxy-beta-L-altropyranose hydrolase [Desulfuromonadaceae bacterium]|nr:UDP-2,4-diacetamido-2,4,6-trideoxy-beta-L-altropyranose hydrolase [Desulfuromonadaceae bacterium]
MKVAFRTDASLQMGSGHIMRCLTLADELHQRAVEVTFICREHSGSLIRIVESKGYRVVKLLQTGTKYTPQHNDVAHAAWLSATWQHDAADTINALNGHKPEWLIIDHYSLDYRWEQQLRPHVGKIMVIDDLADRPHDCDLLLDQNWFAQKMANRYDKLVPVNCIKLLGPQYALLKPEYAQLRVMMPPRDGIVRRVLVFMGGSDPTNETAKVLTALMASNLTDLAVDVVIGINHPDPASIEALVASRKATFLHRNLSTLAGYMSRADLMIGAGGATMWERLCLGLPCIVVSIASNQTATCKDLMENGYICFLGKMSDVTVDDIRNAVHQSITSPGRLIYQSERAKALVPSATGTTQISNCLFTY